MILSFIVALGMFAPQAANPADALIGTWVSVVKPGPGEAPAIPPMLTFQREGNKLSMTIEGSEAKVDVTTFKGSAPGETFAVVRPAPNRMYVIRVATKDQLRCDLFMEYPGTRAVNNFVYGENYKRSK